MTELAGVRTISVGGRPQHGPMQTASGNRGAAVYSAYSLSLDYDRLSSTLRDEAAFELLRLRNDTGMFTNYATFNIRDQMRSDDLTPLQFRYEASDCRLYYTPKNVYNMTQLWIDAATATWNDTSLYVPDSTNYSKSTTQDRKDPPKPSAEVPTPYEASDSPLNDPLDVLHNSTVGLLNKPGVAPNFYIYSKCGGAYGGCESGYVCKKGLRTTCEFEQDNAAVDLCLIDCTNMKSPDCRRLDSTTSQTAGQGLVKRAPPVSGRLGKPGGTSFSRSAEGLRPAPEIVQKRVYPGYIDPGILRSRDYLENVPSFCI